MSNAVGEMLVWGIGDDESSYGAGGAIDRFFEPMPGETLHHEGIRRKVPGLRGGVRNGELGTRDRLVGQTANGDVPMLVPATGFGRILKHITGGTPAITGGGAAKTQVYNTGVILGSSFPMQKQQRDSADVIVGNAFTLVGCKLPKASFRIDETTGFLQCVLSVDAQRQRTDVSAASPVYLERTYFAYEEGAITLNGTLLANVVATAGFDFENPMNINKRRLGNAGLKGEPTDNGRPKVSGTMDVDFVDMTIHDLYTAGTPVSLRTKFTSATNIPTTATPFSIEFFWPEIHLGGTTPQTPNEGDVTPSIPWEAFVDPALDPQSTITYITSDAAA